MKHKQWILPLLFAVLLLCSGHAAAAEALSEPSLQPDSSDAVPPAADNDDMPSDPEAPAINLYTETLGDCRIGDGESISYTTISSEFAGRPDLDGYYPGELTVEITGSVVIEADGVLSIGTLSIGGSEASPTVSWQPGAQIIVEAGGQLQLTDVIFQGTGNGPVILQQPGGSVELTATAVEPGWIQWSSPLVDNLYTQPDDLWLEAGTPLTLDELPRSLTVDVQTEGITQTVQLKLAWNLEEYDGRTDGEYRLTGSFLDETGQPLCSLVPLELTVRWYTPETLVVTNAEWKGNTVPSAQLTVPQLPADAQVWGEVSVDNGITWERWDTEDVFFIVEAEPGGFACIFVLPDQTPRLFRIAAEDPWEHRYWRSEAFTLAPAGQDDSGGNRGGSTTPVTPDREPTLSEDALPEVIPPEEPLPQETEPEASTEVPVPESTEETPQTPESVQQPVNQPPAAQEPAIVPDQAEDTPDPVATQPTVSVDAAAEADAPTSTPQEPAVPEVPDVPEPAASTPPASNTDAPLPVPFQGLLVAAGLVICVGIAMAITRIGLFRRRS